MVPSPSGGSNTVQYCACVCICIGIINKLVPHLPPASVLDPRFLCIPCTVDAFTRHCGCISLNQRKLYFVALSKSNKNNSPFYTSLIE